MMIKPVKSKSLAIAALGISCIALGQDVPLAQRVDSRYKAAAADGFSGSALVVKAGRVVLTGGYGLADRAAKRQIQPSTIFPIGSVTKWFTAMVVLRLEQEKKLKLSDPISLYIPGVPADKAKITIENLLAHTAGLGEYVDRPGEGGDFAPIDKATALKRILGEKLKFVPGKRTEYSNEGYTLLAVVIEKATRRPYEECVRNHIFRPAKLNRTGFFGEQKWPASEFAIGYNAKSHGTVNCPYYWGAPTWSIKGAGGIVSTCEDLGKVILALTQGKILDAAHEPRMFQPLFQQEGFGWMVGRTMAGEPFCNVGGGDNFGFQTAVLYLPRSGNIVITCSNSDTPNKMRDANLDVMKSLK